MDLFIILCTVVSVFYIGHVVLHKLLDKLEENEEAIKLDLFPRDEK